MCEMIQNEKGKKTLGKWKDLKRKGSRREIYKIIPWGPWGIKKKYRGGNEEKAAKQHLQCVLYFYPFLSFPFIFPCCSLLHFSLSIFPALKFCRLPSFNFVDSLHHLSHDERWGAGVETPKNVRGEFGGWGRVPFNEPYAPSLSTIYDGA